MSQLLFYMKTFMDIRKDILKETAATLYAAPFFDEFVKILKRKFCRDSILLFLSDATSYIIKAAQAIQFFHKLYYLCMCIVYILCNIYIVYLCVIVVFRAVTMYANL